MKTVIYFMLTLSLCASCFAKENVQTSLPKAEVAAIEAFFKEFKEAFNAKDVERVRKMSGKTWERWSNNMRRNVRLDSVRIIGITADATTNVHTMATAIEIGGKVRAEEVVFTLSKGVDGFCIEGMIVPNGVMMEKMWRSAIGVKEKLIDAINARNMDVVKSMLTFQDSHDFDADLLSRGLMWIKSAIDSGVVVSREDSGVSCEGEDTIVGRICIPCSPGGTNVLQRFIFKDGKIDRAAPRKETKEEFMKRIKAENEKMRKEWEAQKAAEEKILEEKLLRQQRSKSR